jgi:hypothetical protein
MRVLIMFLKPIKGLVDSSAFCPKLLYYCYAFLVVGQVLDGLTTKIGLNLGLAEVGTFAMGVLSDYGFWGLMVWKYSIIAAIGVVYLLFYYGVKKYAFAHLKVASLILAVGCIFALIGTVQVVMSNIFQIQLVL